MVSGVEENVLPPSVLLLNRIFWFSVHATYTKSPLTTTWELKDEKVDWLKLIGVLKSAAPANAFWAPVGTKRRTENVINVSNLFNYQNMTLEL